MNKLSVLSLSLFLAACGGGGGSDSAPATNTVTVSPSLGKFSAGAKVTIKNLSGTTLGTGDTTSAGTASVNIGTHSGPILIEVAGGAGVTYFDESDKSSQPFGASEKLSALAPAFNANIGVTAATHAAVAAVKAKNSTLIPSSLTADNIQLANSKIAAALGIADVLQAPKLVDSSTSTTLDLADVKDKYALQLAALAKLAGTGKNAFDVAKDLASDLADDKLDGKFDPGLGGTIVANTSTATFDSTTIKALLESKLVIAATDFGTADTKSIVTNDPTTVGTIKPDVSVVVAPPTGTNTTYLQKAKAMFAELRTTLRSYVNNGKTGFLDNQAKIAGDDLDASVSPAMDTVIFRIGAIKTAIDTYVLAKAGNASGAGWSTGVDPVSGTGSVLIFQSGSLNSVYNKTGGMNKCWTDSTVAANLTKVTCLHAGVQGYDGTNNRIKFVRFELTPGSSATAFSYTAARYNATITTTNFDGSPATLGTPSQAKNALLTTASTPVYVASGSGTTSYTKDSNDKLISVTLDGTMPPSSSVCVAPNSDSLTQQSPGCKTGQIEIPATGVDTVKINGSRTALATAGHYRYALTGSVSAVKATDSTKTVSLSLDNGTYVDVNENVTNGQSTAAKLIGTIQTAATKFTGTATLGSFVTNTFTSDRFPSSAVFSGSVTDISTGGAGEILTGKLETSVSNWGSYNPVVGPNSSNYLLGTLTFTGTVAAPSRPVMKLVLSGTTTGFRKGTMTMSYNYGTTTITGTGTSDNGTTRLTLSNQDGIQLASDATDSTKVNITKSGGALGFIKDNKVNYVDGFTESAQ